MRQKLRLLTQILLLISLPAFVLRPVMVTLQNSVQLSKAAPIQKSFDNALASLTGGQPTLHSVSRENSQFPSLVPSFTRMILPSSVTAVSGFAPQMVDLSPRSSLILRI